LALVSNASARSSVDEFFAIASKKFDIPLEVLIAVKHVESGSRLDNAIVNKNANGTFDLGVMQVNSSWLPTLAQFGVDAETLLENHCVNIAVGAWILADAMDKTSNLAEALSMYNSGRAYSMAGVKYVSRVRNTLAMMLSP
jgi:soluble lytic murein transglycosylase-like protein